MLLKKEFVLSLREKQQHNIEFPTFKLPQVLTIFYDLTYLILFVMFSVYDY